MESEIADLIVRGGTIIDGTGAPERQADLVVADGTIVAVGADIAGSYSGGLPKERIIDADGLVVTPGFVDLHTHLDAQIGWDPLLTSSCYHGVTSVVMGNCGMTFAPVNSGEGDFLARVMESVEDIPADSIRAALPFSWNTFSEFLDWVESKPRAINVAALVGHAALRYWAMGEASMDPEALPTEGQLEKMTSEIRSAVSSGAWGFSTSRTLRHSTPDGRFVPGTFAQKAELLALASATREAGGKLLGCAPRFDGEGPSEPRVHSEMKWMREVALETGLPFTFNLNQTYSQGDHWRSVIELASAANRDGALLRPQTTPRGIGVLWGLDHHTPFDRFGAWRELVAKPVAEKLAAFLDLAWRERLIHDASAMSTESCDAFYVVNTPEGHSRYDQRPENSLGVIARNAGVSAAEAYIDLALKTQGAVVLSWPVLNQDPEAVMTMLQSDVVILGLADAGAHVGQILDASQPTWWLSHWCRDEKRMSREEAVRRLTSDTATFGGMTDRGVLRVGARADINLLDWEALALPPPYITRDMPLGSPRWAQKAFGYVKTIVGGEITFSDGEHTGALPGELIKPAA